MKIKFKIILFLLVFLTFNFLLLTFLPTGHQPTVYANHNLCHSDASPPPRADGLVATPELPATSKFRSTSGVCVINDPAARLGPSAFGTGNIYDNLKATYYDKAKTSASLQKVPIIETGTPATQANLTFTTNTLVYVGGSPGDLNLAGNATGTSTGVVFIDGNLNINSNYTYGDAGSGTVFVVRGNVNIAPAVTTINAVIISTGTIDTSVPSVSSTQLVINGSLVSLNQVQAIQFHRDLAASNSTTPAEKVNFQPKYLVILRDLFSQTDQRWSEVAGRVNVPAPATPVPTATPSPSPTPSPTPAAVDVDGDGYQAGPIGTTCPNGLPCDCYDLNANAHPNLAVGTYFTTTRGTAAQGNDAAGNTWSSYDYDCDGSSTQRAIGAVTYAYYEDPSCTVAIPFNNALIGGGGCGQYCGSAYGRTDMACCYSSTLVSSYIVSGSCVPHTVVPKCTTVSSDFIQSCR